MKIKLSFFLIAGIFLGGCNYELQNRSQTANDATGAENRSGQNANAKTNINAPISNTDSGAANDEGGKLILTGTGRN